MKKVRWLVFLVVAALAVANTARTMMEIYLRSQRLERSREEVVALGEEKRDLEEGLAQAKTPETIEDLARQKLNMIFPGEKIVILPQVSQRVSQAVLGNRENRSNWRRWLEIF
ncbi:MAG: septum formation initiator family protein [bacterium]|nr:septum formation initiator family protein [bacterium]